MYYIIMYGSVLLGIVGLLIMGIGMVITPNDKVKLKPGQDRQTAVKNMQMCIRDRPYIVPTYG